MRWKFWDRTGKARELTLSLKLALSNQHRLRPREIDPLRFIDQRAPSADGRATVFRIFDPARLEGGQAAKLTFAQLDRQRKAVCFEGEIDVHKVIGRLRDVRA